MGTHKNQLSATLGLHQSSITLTKSYEATLGPVNWIVVDHKRNKKIPYSIVYDELNNMKYKSKVELMTKNVTK